VTNSDNFHILVVGPGALGCLIATTLALHNFNVSLLDHNCPRTAVLNDRGLVLIRGGRIFHVVVPVYCKPSAVPPADVIFLCVKSATVERAVKAIRDLFHSENLLITLQNGISHLEELTKRTDSPNWAAGVTALGANLKREGEVVFAGSGISRFGFLHWESPALKQKHLLQRAVAVFNRCGLQAEFSEEIERHIWGKLLINAGINALTAIHDCPNGDLLLNENRMRTMHEAINEAAGVARRKGVQIEGDPMSEAVKVCRATAANISSMLQDVRRRRPTEIDAINGAIVRLAEHFKIPAPVNTMLTGKVKEIERSYKREC
jgi:2-dehydropantoate 2-reductase